MAFGMNWRNVGQAAGQGAISYVGILPVIFGVSLIYQLFLYAAGYPVTLQDVVEIFLEPQPGWNLLLLMVLAVVVAPIVEEMLFRGILLPALMKKVGLGAAVVANSILFALIHQHLPSLIPLFALALALSLLYVYSGSLWSAIILHALFNGISICVLLLIAP
jgi:membrane protease YdiL (CAAX protease family)